jgi:P4 family phage/plasmid primase-like protien
MSTVKTYPLNFLAPTPKSEYEDNRPNVYGLPKKFGDQWVSMGPMPENVEAICIDHNGIETYHDADSEISYRYTDGRKSDFSEPFYRVRTNGEVYRHSNLADAAGEKIVQLDRRQLKDIFRGEKDRMVDKRGTPKFIKGTHIGDEVAQEKPTEVEPDFVYIKPREANEVKIVGSVATRSLAPPENLVGIIKDRNGIEAYLYTPIPGQGHQILNRYSIDPLFDLTNPYYITFTDGDYQYYHGAGHEKNKHVGTLNERDIESIFPKKDNGPSMEQVTSSVNNQLQVSAQKPASKSVPKSAPKSVPAKGNKRKPKTIPLIYVPDNVPLETVENDLRTLIMLCAEKEESQMYLVPVFEYILRDTFKVINSKNSEIYYWNESRKLWAEGTKETMAHFIGKGLPDIVRTIYIEFCTQHNTLRPLYDGLTEDDMEDSEKAGYKSFRRICHITKQLREILTGVGKVQYINQVISATLPTLQDLEFSALLNSRPDLISVANGVVDLRTGELRERTRGDYFTYALKTRYNKDADKTATIEMVNNLMVGDKALVDCLQMILGYCITGEQSLKAFYIFHGPEGDNAKSTFLMILEILLERLAKSIPNETILDFNKKNANPAGHKAHIVALKGKRLVTTSEVTKEDKLNNNLIKSFTGSDMQSGRGVHEKEETSFFPECKFILNCNKIPSLSTLDPRMIKRTVLIPFDCIFIENPDPNNPKHKKADPHFRERFTKNLVAMEGLLTWLVEGAVIFYSGDHPVLAEAIMNKNHEYADSQNFYLRFKREKLIEPPGPFPNDEGTGVKFIPTDWRLGAEELYNAYCNWCKFEARISIVDNNEFGEQMSKLLSRRRGRSGMLYVCQYQQPSIHGD